MQSDIYEPRGQSRREPARSGLPRDIAESHAIFIGIDPALKSDYFAIVVNIVPLSPDGGGRQLPRLAYLDQMKATRYQDIFESLQRGALNQFVNLTSLYIDYTNNQAIGDMFEDQYGKDRVKKIVFTAGESGTKMQLMQKFNAALKSGYALPDTRTITNPRLRDLVEKLRSQMLQEQYEYNNGIARFRHKGPHNDLLHACALSISAAIDWLDSNRGDGSHVGGPVYTGRPGSEFDAPDYGDLFGTGGISG